MAYYHSLITRSRLYPVLVLEQWISHARRLFVLKIGLLVLLLGAASSLWLGSAARLAGGLLLLLAIALIVLLLLDFYFRSRYYPSIISSQYRPDDLVTFTVGRILYGVGANDDVTGAWLASRSGRLVLARLGISRQEQKMFAAHRSPVALPAISPSGPVLVLSELVGGLLKHDAEFRAWLLSKGCTEAEVLGAVAWVVRSIEAAAVAERWWSRERLSQIAPLAADWSYGSIYALDRYSRELVAAGAAPAIGSPEARPELRQLIAILERHREANALLVGDSRESGLGVVWQMAGLIQSLAVSPALRGKKIILFETALLAASFKERSAFEQELIKIFNEAVGAGNVILVIDDLAALIRAGNALYADVAALLEPFLSGSAIQVIALSDTSTFHAVLSSQPLVMQRFEKLSVGSLSAAERFRLAEQVVAEAEARHEAFFTYQSVAALASGAEQYFQSELATDKVVDLVTEIIPWAAARKARVITKELAEEFLSQKTHIPVGAAGAEEAERLLSLEEKLGARVIGQPLAVQSIARAMRRGRAGVRNPKRPTASFLFLGPTGVGKTETAKALAAEYFGNEEAMLRFDMSEFQGSDALPRLIGSPERGLVGVLATRIREQPYGVLLLDEFEKSHRDVRNLFLQILDEGFFSDAAGRRVNARNLIIIATSNAGAATLWQLVRSGQDVAAAREELIRTIIAEGIYTPELINRFDDVIVFNPLTGSGLSGVAELQLGRLAKRLYDEHAIVLKLTPTLVELVASRGANEAFGARPMQRFIQDELEEKIASALIKGDIKSGSQVEFDHALKLVAT